MIQNSYRYRLLTWNINSVRLRLPLLARLVAEYSPEIVCLQETKTENKTFPESDLRALGFTHIQFHGQKSYNGVAILSRRPMTPLTSFNLTGNGDARHIAARLENGTEIHNFYVPAGGDIPDPEENPKFAHKLAFLDEMTQWSRAQSASSPSILVGDLNVAPGEHDVWSHKQLLDVVSHTPVEIERLRALQESRHWIDTARHFIPENEKSYSWWSYRNRDWRASNRGRRLDHIWVTEPLRTQLHSYQALSDLRDWQSPSDHVPVMVEIKDR